MMSESMLIIEDERLLGTELKRHYQRNGWDVTLADTLTKARQLLSTDVLDPLVVISDMTLPDGNALDLLDEIAQHHRNIGEWIFLTGYGGVPESVRALRLGAFDFFEKPFEQDRLDLVVAGACRSAEAHRKLRDMARAGNRRYRPDAFAGTSPAAQLVRELIEKISSVPFSSLIISGETGTGKGLVTRILHHMGLRQDGPLVEINCAALPKELLESELFGHEAGAFTGAKGRHRGLMEQAHGGTLFLDEISEMEFDLQSKLLRAIEDHTIRRLGGDREIKVDVQIIAASNRDLRRRIKDGKFRNDLYHRLSVFSLELPSLRGRLEDLDELIPLLIAEFNAIAGKKVKRIPDAVWNELKTHDWPGNVRELRNVIERCVLFSEGEELPSRWLQLVSLDDEADKKIPTSADNVLMIPTDGSMALDEMDCHIIKHVLEINNHNVTATARALGTTRETLRYRIQKYSLKIAPG